MGPVIKYRDMLVLKSKGNLILALAALFVFMAAGCQRESHPVPGRDSFSEVAVYEEQSEALVDWLRKGYRDMAVVNVDYHGDLWRVPDVKMDELESLADDERWEEILSRSGPTDARMLFTAEDFLYPAYRLGVVKRLYWVTPSRLLDYPDPEVGVRDLLMAFGYPEDAVKTFRKDGNTVRGEILGLDVTVTSIRGLPRIKEPVLLAVDADYFSNKLMKENPSELEVLRDFFIYLRSKEIEVRHASVAYSVKGGYTDITARHIGDEVAGMLRDPEVAMGGGFPGLWRSRAVGYEFLREDRPEFALREFEEGLKAFGEETSLLCGKAVSLALVGRDDEALVRLRRLSELSDGYRHAYIHIGRKLRKGGSAERAERYLREYLKGNPDSVDGLLVYGNFLYNAERDEEALKAYLKVISLADNVDAVMYAGDALAQLKRYNEAMKYYERGLKLLEEVGYRSLRDFPGAKQNIEILRRAGIP
jgi:tetratricopeptide (TPR) repeat protein